MLSEDHSLPAPHKDLSKLFKDSFFKYNDLGDGCYSESFTTLGKSNNDFKCLCKFYTSTPTIISFVTSTVSERFSRRSQLTFHFKGKSYWDNIIDDHRPKRPIQEKVLNADAVIKEFEDDLLKLSEAQREMWDWAKSNGATTMLSESIMPVECFDNIRRLGEQLGVDIPSFTTTSGNTEKIVNFSEDNSGFQLEGIIEQLIHSELQKEDPRILKLQNLIGFPRLQTDYNFVTAPYGSRLQTTFNFEITPYSFTSLKADLAPARKLIATLMENYFCINASPDWKSLSDKINIKIRGLAYTLDKLRNCEKFLGEVCEAVSSLKNDEIKLPEKLQELIKKHVADTICRTYPGLIDAVYGEALKVCDYIASNHRSSLPEYIAPAVPIPQVYPDFIREIASQHYHGTEGIIDKVINYVPSFHFQRINSTFFESMNRGSEKICRMFVAKDRHSIQANNGDHVTSSSKQSKNRLLQLETKKIEYLNKYKIKVSKGPEVEVCIPAGTNLFNFFKEADQIAHDLYGIHLKMKFHLNWWKNRKIKEDIKFKAEISPYHSSDRAVSDEGYLTNPIHISVAIISHLIATGDRSLVELISEKKYGMAFNTLADNENSEQFVCYRNGGFDVLDVNYSVEHGTEEVRPGCHRNVKYLVCNVDRSYLKRIQ